MIILVDIDNTLYSFEETGFGRRMHERIIEYVMEHLSLSEQAAREKCQYYYTNYGLSLYGFHKHDGIEPKGYCDHVHQCDYSILCHNEELRMLIEKLKTGANAQFGGPHSLYFFTNADSGHAVDVLRPLGLLPLFLESRGGDEADPPATSAYVCAHPELHGQRILGFSFEDQWRLTGPEEPANKPMARAYEMVFKALQGGDEAMGNPARHPNLCVSDMVMVDDSVMNVRTPLTLGWKAVWISYGQAVPQDLEVYVSAGSFVAINTIMELGEAIGKLSSGPA